MPTARSDVKENSRFRSRSKGNQNGQVDGGTTWTAAKIKARKANI